MKNLATVYRAQGQLDDVTRSFTEAREAYEAINRPLGIANCLYGLGLVYYRQDKDEEALNMAIDAHGRYVALGEPLVIGNSAYFMLGRYEEAADALLKAVRSYEFVGGGPQDLSRATQLLGRAYSKLGM